MIESAADDDRPGGRRHRMGHTVYKDSPLLDAGPARIKRIRRPLRTTIGLLAAAAAAFGFATLLFIGDFVEGPITAFIAILPRSNPTATRSAPMRLPGR
jgi:hypothetical protein